MRSAIRTVENRCDTSTVIRPVALFRVPRRGGIALEEHMLGFRVERRGRFIEDQHQRRLAHESARERQLLPLPERQVDAVRPRRTELRVESELSVAPPRRPLPRARPPRPPRVRSSIRGISPRPTVCPARNSKRKKSWNAPAMRARHSPAGIRASGTASTRIAPDVGSTFWRAA